MGFAASGQRAILAGMEIHQVIADPRQYDHSRALWIAEQYADGDISLRELHRLHEDRVPSPYWLYRWRRDYPDFDLMMRDAERVRAQNLADDVLAVADDDAGGNAATRRVKMQARQWIAERYDRERYGGASKVEHKHSGSVSVDLPALSDEQLAAIAGGDRPALEGQSERVFVGDPHPPRQGAKAPVAAEASDPPPSLAHFRPASHTGNAIDESASPPLSLTEDEQ